MIIVLTIAGKIRTQIENPEDLKTLNSLFLFNFIYVFMELSKKTVGRMIGNNDGRWKIASFNKITNSISLLAPLLMSSIKSMEKNKIEENIKTIKNEYKFPLSKYLKTIRFFIMT